MDTDLLFEYVHPSIQTHVAWSLDNEVPNCKSHFLLLCLAHALWPLFSLIHFSSSSSCFLHAVLAFDILINTNKRIELIFFLIFSKLLPCLQLRQGKTTLGSTIPTEDTDCPRVIDI